MLLYALQDALTRTWASCDARADALVLHDVDGDHRADACVRIAGAWLVARTIEGWKASGWKGAESFGAALAAELERRASEGAGDAPVLEPPPYQLDAAYAFSSRGDVDGDGVDDTLRAFRCTRPGSFLELRLEPSDARLRDGDGDGLLDAWESEGLPRGIDGGNAKLDPRRPDVICVVAPHEGVDRAKLERELLSVARIYDAAGVQFWWRMDPSLPPERQAGGDWAACAALNFPARERGLLHWMQVTNSGGGQAQQTGDMGGCGNGFAVFAHEFGHQLSLSHTGDSEPAWCPLYPSLLNYAYNYSLGGNASAVKLSDGRFASVELREDRLEERLPFALDSLRFLAAPPYRFTLAADGEHSTRVDWNHDGAFSDTPVRADINYGGSTSCGIRRDLGGVLTGAAPALAYVGERAWLATLDATQATVSLRSYEGNERWSAPRAVPDSATNEDPLLVDAWGRGMLLTRRVGGWSASLFDASEVRERADVAGLPDRELSVARVGDRILFVTRTSEGALEAYWLDGAERLEVSRGGVLALESAVAVGLGVDPRDGRIVLASAATNAKGTPFCLRVSWLAPDGDALQVQETVWVRGDAGARCSTRPLVAFDEQGQLNLFHTEMPGLEGQMNFTRTRRIGNAKLDDGWLSSTLYDVWTRTRRPLAFAAGAQGALFAFRWDAAEAHGMRVNGLLVAHQGFGIDPEPMRDFDDGAKIRLHGLAHSILWMQER